MYFDIHVFIVFLTMHFVCTYTAIVYILDDTLQALITIYTSNLIVHTYVLEL